MRKLSDVKTILFDLDGTLYQDLSFHRRYVELLLERTEYASWTADMIALADDILERGRLPMNRFYRFQTRPVEDVAEFVALLEDSLLEGMHFEQVYAEKNRELFFLGDAWAVGTMIGRALDLPGEITQYAFMTVRDEMLRDRHEVHPNVVRVLDDLGKKYRTVLLSNSPEKTASEYVEALGLHRSFGLYGYGADKPYFLMENLGKLCPDAVENPRTLLSVGDHLLNEIANVSLAGGHTIWVDPYGAKNCPVQCDAVLDGPEAVAQFLENEML